MGLFKKLLGAGRGAPVLQDERIRHLADRAVADLEAKTAAHDAILHFQECTWSVDQDAGTIIFDRKNGFRATAPVQIIGTYNITDGSWLWAWDNPSISEPLLRDAKTLLSFGNEKKIDALTTRKISCQESDCWEFTALACKLNDMQGAYRGPAGATLIFMTFGNIELSKP